MKVNRYKPAIRRELILNAAVEVARKPGGWGTLTRQKIAQQADVSDGLVSRYLGDMPDARRAIIKVAVRDEIVEILAQSIGSHDGYVTAKWLPKSLKRKAIASLLS